MIYDNFVITKQTLKIRGLLLQIIATMAIWSTLPAVILIHCTIWIYQQVYFTIYGMPKARYRDYYIVDRHKLKKLNWFQKFACMYCGYANGTAAWVKVIANRTEVYSCAIKHNVHKEGQEHQKQFFAYEKFR
ncbi:hypothetical protein A3B61_00055 [Candidatus Peribacteria bacterium RIFCSPLOWO2_01_FULL_53_10]|nr:MAG: hypothetical protein A3B61_00055 [Candidatus Peribacteria bacterium RIFCSPLOWO2_01_FULL_53_10]